MSEFPTLTCKHITPGMLILIKDDREVSFVYIVSIVNELVGTWQCLRVISIHHLINGEIRVANYLLNNDSIFIFSAHEIIAV